MKPSYTREDVIEIIDNLLQHADAVLDCITNENPALDAADLLDMVLESLNKQNS